MRSSTKERWAMDRGDAGRRHALLRLCSQWRIPSSPCDKSTRRANHQKSVQTFAQKYFAGLVGQIRRLTSPVYRDKRGDRDRHDRAVGCDGR